MDEIGEARIRVWAYNALGPAMPLSFGARLGPYEIQAAIGAGGMGKVYKARDA